MQLLRAGGQTCKRRGWDGKRFGGKDWNLEGEKQVLLCFWIPFWREKESNVQLILN